MSNFEIKDNLEKQGDSETSARAEKIKAIREAIHNKENSTTENPVASNADAMGISTSNAEKTESAVKDMPKIKKGKKKKKKKKPLKKRIRGLFPEKGDGSVEIIRKIVFLIAVIAIIVCGYLISDYYIDLWKSRMQYNNISGIYETYEPIYLEETEVEDEKKREKYYSMLDGARKLLDINPDTIGYIRIPSKDGDPIIDLPVVQAEDNMKYLDRNFNGDDSRTGALFLDFRNHFDEVENHKLVQPNSDNLVIYGHNMADESMFGKLKYYYHNAEYFTEHPIIHFNSNYETYKYKIFAIFIVDAKDESESKYDCWNQLNFDGEEEFYNFVNEAKRRSIYTNGVDVKYGDGILSLSTCHYLLQDRSRLIIMARTVRKGEDLYKGTEKSERNPNIKWPTMYYNSKPNEKYDEEAIFVPYGPEEEVKKAEKALAEKKKREEEERKKKEEEKKKKEEAAMSTGKSSSKSTSKNTSNKAKTTVGAKALSND